MNPRRKEAVDRIDPAAANLGLSRDEFARNVRAFRHRARRAGRYSRGLETVG